MGFFRAFLIPSITNIAIIMGLFLLAAKVHTFVLVFAMYGITSTLISLRQSTAGIVSSFNNLAFGFGVLISMRLYGPRSLIQPWMPADGLENAKFNSRFHKISCAFSFLFWLILGAMIEFSMFLYMHRNDYYG